MPRVSIALLRLSQLNGSWTMAIGSKGPQTTPYSAMNFCSAIGIAYSVMYWHLYIAYYMRDIELQEGYILLSLTSVAIYVNTYWYTRVHYFIHACSSPIVMF